MKINVNTGIEETSGEIIALRDFANLLKLKIIYMNTARQITLTAETARNLFWRCFLRLLSCMMRWVCGMRPAGRRPRSMS